MKSKTIILSSPNTNGRAILTLFEEDELLKSKIRLYNTTKLNRFCKLGIYHNKNVFSANLLEKDGVYLSSMVGEFDLEKDFYCAIINTENNNDVVLSGGTYSGCFFNEENVFENKLRTIEKENPNTSLYNYEEEKIEENLINNSCEEDFEKCKNCKYKEWFYAQQKENSFDEKPFNEETFYQEKTQTNEFEKKEVETQYQQFNTPSLISHFKTIFDSYPEDKSLTNLIPNGKFVKINENNSNYSIGAIFENDEMKYICYATLCNYNSPIPSEIGEHYQWLPLDKEDPMSEGYYIVFQDAKDLKIVEL